MKILKVFLKVFLLAIACLVVFILGVFMFYEPVHAASSEAVCSRPDIIICEDFEAWTFSGSADANAGYPNLVGAATAQWTANGWNLGQSLTSFPGSNVYRQTFVPVGVPTYGNNGSATALQLKTNPSNAGAVQYPDKPFSRPDCVPLVTCHIRIYMRFSDNFVFPSTILCCTQKLWYFRKDVSGSLAWRVEVGLNSKTTRFDTYSYATTACPSGGARDTTRGDLSLDLNVHTYIYHEWGLYNEVTAACSTVTPDPRPLTYIQGGRWYSIEVMVKPNSPSGATNGALAMWIDGLQVINRPNIDVGSGGLGVGYLWLTTYSGDAPGWFINGAQDVRFDNIVAGTSYIGPIGGAGAPTLPPAQVQGVTVTP